MIEFHSKFTVVAGCKINGRQICLPGEKIFRKLFKNPGFLVVVDMGGVTVVVVLGKYLTVFVLFGATVGACGRTSVCPISGFA